jgi:hypothetical protein
MTSGLIGEDLEDVKSVHPRIFDADLIGFWNEGNPTGG